MSSTPTAPPSADPRPAADPPARPRRNGLRRWGLRLGLAALSLGLAATLALGLAVVLVPFDTALLAHAPVESRSIFDRHGRLLREALNDQEGRGTWRRLDAVSPWLPRAFLALEDRRFHTHHGLDPRGIARALRDNLSAGRLVAGGSTLTQQLVGLLVPRPRSLRGKLAEALDALRLERAVSKSEILTQYLNRAPFGHGAVGVEAAARLYFDTRADRLSLAQAALLAGIPRAPSLNNPLTDPQRARRRQAEVLAQLRVVGAIDAAAEAEALAEPLRYVPPEHRFLAPHFASHVLAQDRASPQLRTSLDLDLQADAEEIAREEVAALREKRVSQAAAVVLDNASGQVLAWVGSIDFFEPETGQVDMVLGLRQPGSTLKPFVYGLGLEAGLSAATRLPDLPLFFPTALGDYRPRNYDRTFHGWVTLREALANSYNVPAVWMANRVGVGEVLHRLRAVGFGSLRRDAAYYGLGLALGNGEVRLIELANAYRTLANDGRHRPWHWRPLDVTDPAAVGAEQGTQVMPAPVARLLTQILADPVARAPAFGRHSVLTLPFPTAAKTGTSTDFTDNWTVGYTTALTVAVWVGNFDGRPMAGISGITGAGRLFHRVMRRAMRDRPTPRFSTEGLRRVTLCRETGQPFGEHTPSGMAAGAACAHPDEEYLIGPEAAQRGAPSIRPAEVARLRVVWPDNGDVFGRDANSPSGYGKLRLRAEAPEAAQRLVFEVDGQAIATTETPFSAWWTPSPGKHRVRVWDAEHPEHPSAGVQFEVLP